MNTTNNLYMDAAHEGIVQFLQSTDEIIESLQNTLKYIKDGQPDEASVIHGVYMAHQNLNDFMLSLVMALEDEYNKENYKNVLTTALGILFVRTSLILTLIEKGVVWDGLSEEP